MGGCSSLGRAILVILNIIFLLVSLVFIAVGSILKFMPDKIMMFLGAGVDTLLPTAVPTFGYDVHLPPIPDTLTFLPMFGDLGVVLLVSGVILFVLSSLACCGACCKWRPFLIVFVIIVIVIIIVLAAMGGLFLVRNSILHKNIRDSLADKAVREHEDKPEGPFSQIMNLLAMKMKCCGFSGPGDYTVDWNTTTNSPKSEPTVPLTCCKTLDEKCILGPGPFHQEGCYDKLLDMLDANKTWGIVALVVILALLLLEVIFAVVIVVAVGKDKVGVI